MNSRSKGKRGELELAHWLSDHWGISVRRGQQFCGNNGDADVVAVDGIYIECKRVQRLNVPEAMQKAILQSASGRLPMLYHRRNNDQWLLTIRASDDFELAETLASILGKPFFPRGDA